MFKKIFIGDLICLIGLIIALTVIVYSDFTYWVSLGMLLFFGAIRYALKGIFPLLNKSRDRYSIHELINTVLFVMFVGMINILRFNIFIVVIVFFLAYELNEYCSFKKEQKKEESFI